LTAIAVFIPRATVSAVSCLVVPAFICIDLLISRVLKINDDDDDDENIALFCEISDLVVLVLFAAASCLIQWRSNKCFQGLNIGRGVTIDRVV